jgi:DNA repair exonuclease SbcCD ATPase subunit
MKAHCLLLILLLFISCKEAPGNFEGGSASTEYKEVPVEINLENLDAPPEERRTPLPPPILLTTARQLIRTANLTIRVNNYTKARKDIEQVLKKFAAQVNQESENRAAYQIENNLVIRVKPMQLDSLMAAIEQIAADIDNKSITVEDITRQYVDLESRLATKRAAVAQYQQLLRSAKTTSAVLEVYEKMNEMIEEIESTEAQLRTLRDQVQQSTLNLTMYQNYNNIAARHEGFGSRLGNALSGGWQGLLTVVVGLIYAWPLLLAMGMVLFFVLRSRKKRKVV